jgi:hypothetical protein
MFGMPQRIETNKNNFILFILVFAVEWKSESTMIRNHHNCNSEETYKFKVNKVKYFYYL